MQLITRQNLFFFLFAAITAVFALWLYNPFNFYFLNDDLIHIPLSKDGVLFQRRSFRPIGDLSVQMDYLIWGKQAWGYHLTNLFLHIANTILVFFLSKEFQKKYAPHPNITIQSLMVSLLFFMYAFHSESIFWILGRSGSLGALFFIPALLLYLKRHESYGMFILSLIFFELGSLAYESVWIFPLVAIVVSAADTKLFNTNIKKEIIFSVSVLVVFIIHLIVRQHVIGEVVGAYEAAGFMQFDLQKLGSNFFKLFSRSFIPPVDSNSTFMIFCFLLLALIIWIIIIIRKQKPTIKKQPFFSAIVFALLVISLLPYLSLGIDTHGAEGERYLYMPSIFVCMLLVCLISNIAHNRALQFLLYSGIVCIHLFFLARSAAHYKTSSAISRIAFQQINLLKGKQRLFVDSLPQSFKGALIFRLGFDEGARWLKEKGTVDSIIVLSLKKDNHAWLTTYDVKELNTFRPGIFNEILIRDTTQQQTYITRKVPPVTFNPQTDSWFIFKDGHLEVIK